MMMFDQPQGFDEYMNLVLDNAAEYDVKTATRKEIGMFATHSGAQVRS
jgi:small nuclear ribonucleoprotein (snRNP)-like protein